MSEGESTGPGAVQKSAAQDLYDRFLKQCNRGNKIRKRLEEVRAAIAGGKIAPPTLNADAVAPPAPALSYFDGLKLLADANDRTLEGLEASVESLAALF